jgi:hypothetical protein
MMAGMGCFSPLALALALTIATPTTPAQEPGPGVKLGGK